jgi:hypothetical protein
MDRDLITKYEGDCVVPNATYNFDNCRISGGNFNLTAYQTFDTIMSLKQPVKCCEFTCNRLNVELRID